MEPGGLGCYTMRMSRQMNKERTRRRLLQAILKTIHRHGHSALTTGRVAQLGRRRPVQRLLGQADGAAPRDDEGGERARAQEGRGAEAGRADAHD